MAGIAVGSFAFAFTRSLPAALLVRFVLLGGCNGWNSILGPICAELGGAEGQAKLLGYVFGAGGVIKLIITHRVAHVRDMEGCLTETKTTRFT